ncbi:MAG: hypothetical protein AAF152_14445 [Cyanobacteria bacterium P01_A01_bin.114]
MNSLTQFLQRWTVPLLLITVALRQIALAHTAALSPWHGGGFGMFASIDRDERRIVEVQATDCNAQVIDVALIPSDELLDDAALTHLRTVPSKTLLTQTAQRILASESYIQSSASSLTLLNSPEVLSQQSLETVTDCLQQVEIQVWRLRHQRQPSLIWYEPITPRVEVSE